MITSKTAHVLIRDLSNLKLQIILDMSWASLNVGLKRAIASNNSRQTALWRFYLHWEIEENGSPDIICIFCHPVFRHPSEHGTSSMEKHLLAKAHITNLNE
jgi:hypothetical protein